MTTLKETRLALLLHAQCPVLEPQSFVMALSTSRRRDGVLATANQTYFEKQSSLLGNLFFCCVCDRHFSLALSLSFA
jgi:hypothetical protein